jgi:ligand-binding sensor domain-containing protein
MNLFMKCFFVTLIIAAIMISPMCVVAQNNPAPLKPEIKVKPIAGLKTRFIVALIFDGKGGAWIRTEDEGIFYCDANNKISQHTTKNGLGDNNGYALAIDKYGLGANRL